MTSTTAETLKTLTNHLATLTARRDELNVEIEVVSKQIGTLVMRSDRETPGKTPLKSLILALFEARTSHQFQIREVHQAFPDLKPATISGSLADLVREGKLLRPRFSYYRLPAGSAQTEKAGDLDLTDEPQETESPA